MMNSKPILAVTMGDAAGIGPEIIAKVAAKGFLLKYAKPIIIGDEHIEKGDGDCQGKLFL